MKRVIIILLVGALVSCSGGGSKSGHEHGHDHGHGHDHASHESEQSNLVHMEPQQIKDLGIQLDKAKSDTIFEVVHVAGSVQNSPGDVYTVGAPVVGQVVFSKVINLGDAVKKGEHLLTIVSNDLVDESLESLFVKAKTDLEYEKSVLDRKRQLFEAGAVSKAELDLAEQHFANAQAQFNTVGRNYSQGGKKIVAAQGGYITSIGLSEGSYCSIGQNILQISENKSLNVETYLPASKMEFSNSIHSATIKLEDQSVARAEVKSVGQLVNPMNGGLPVILGVRELGHVFPGQYVDVYLNCGEPQTGIMVNESALIEDFGKYQLVVKVNDHDFEIRTVKLGKRGASMVEILHGLTEGETIVTEGAFQIKMAKVAGKIPAHVH